MAKPASLQQLDKGKLLTGSNFPEFVDTWNYSINRIENLKGDKDGNPETGHITVDNTDPEHPIIRWSGKEGGDDFNGVKSITGSTTESVALSGDVVIAANENVGITYTSYNDGTVEMDIAERGEDEQYGAREITIGEEVVAKVFGTTDFEITEKQIKAGDGIEITEDEEGAIVISTTLSGETSGYTGERQVLVDVDYHAHQLRKKFATEVWKDGVLESTTEGAWETYHEAVEETV